MQHTLRHQTVSHALTEFVSYAALCLFSGGNIGFGYIILDDADSLSDLAAPLGNRLEALHGNREGQYSIRINDQWRICFMWTNGKANDVEITDYHK